MIDTTDVPLGEHGKLLVNLSSNRSDINQESNKAKHLKTGTMRSLSKASKIGEWAFRVLDLLASSSPASLSRHEVLLSQTAFLNVRPSLPAHSRLYPLLGHFLSLLRLDW